MYAWSHPVDTQIINSLHINFIVTKYRLPSQCSDEDTHEAAFVIVGRGKYIIGTQ